MKILILLLFLATTAMSADKTDEKLSDKWRSARRRLVHIEEEWRSYCKSVDRTLGSNPLSGEPGCVVPPPPAPAQSPEASKPRTNPNSKEPGK